ncbi:hypothetical protein ACHAWF_015586 [Thalassiosira exigua]
MPSSSAFRIDDDAAARTAGEEEDEGDDKEDDEEDGESRHLLFRRPPPSSFSFSTPHRLLCHASLSDSSTTTPWTMPPFPPPPRRRRRRSLRRGGLRTDLSLLSSRTIQKALLLTLLLSLVVRDWRFASEGRGRRVPPSRKRFHSVFLHPGSDPLVNNSAEYKRQVHKSLSSTRLRTLSTQMSYCLDEGHERRT